MIEQIEFVAEASREAALFAASRASRSRLLTGRVIHGNKLGRELGIPTANLAISPEDAPAFGIYAVTAFLAGEAVAGIASWGTRPHFDDGAPLLEVHLFDFGRNIYGTMLAVRFDLYLRAEARFANVGEFMKQIQDDIAEARRFHQI